VSVGTSKFDPTNPLSYDDFTTIPTPKNDAVTVLVGALSADAYGNAGGVSTDIAVADASGLPIYGWISVGKEIISYAGKSGNTLNGCVRGAQSTVIAAHGNRSPVVFNFTAQHLQVLIDAVIALQKLVVNRKFDTGTTSGGSTITLTGTPISTDKVLLWVNGVFYQHSVDFAVSGTVLTWSMNPVPPAGLSYLAFYTKQ
jgi:hypothetical protein